MNSITQNKRYCPHEITTKINSVKLYRETKDISFVCRRYHISKASLMRWNKLYDGTKESLIPKSHRPHTPHPKAHTEEELKWICDQHHVLRPRTPWHNGKVERSHRNDQERFYNYLSFYSFNDLQKQMKRYLYRANNIPMAVLGWKSPNQRHRELGGR